MLSRREYLAALPILATTPALAYPLPTLRLSSFSTEITPPIGHPCMGGGVSPVVKILDPLFAKGLILHGTALDQPVIWAALDWCEIRNDAYDAWRKALAQAAGTVPNRVMLSCLHQHDAPIADLYAEQLLRDNQAKGSICDLKFHAEVVDRVAKDVARAMKVSEPITHVGHGQAEVRQVGSNRRYTDAQGQIRYNRTSATGDPAIREAEVGTIDPNLKSFSFWNGSKPLAAVHAYATHPMSYYGKGEVTADFVGLARKLHQADWPEVPQIYLSGCSGNVTAGKFNDGSPAQRPLLAQRLYDAMKRSWQATVKQPVEAVRFRNVSIELEARSGEEFSQAGLLKRLREDPRPFGQCLAALGLSWRNRVESGQPIDLPVLDFGTSLFAVLPAEIYVEFQLYAQSVRPKSFVMVAGYGECGPGYIPIERAWKENDHNLSDWSWVNPGSEERMKAAIRKALAG